MNSADSGFERAVTSGRQETFTGIIHYRVGEPVGIREFLLQRNHAQADYFLHHGCVYVDGVRRRTDMMLTPDQVLRLHTRPKKYLWAAGPLQDRLIYNGDEFLVLDKPGGLPVHATLDNFVENAKYILEQELGMILFSTHRLDIPTRGLLILAKTPDAQSLINKLFAARRVEKIYRAVTARPVAAGEQILYLNPDARVPRPHSFEPIEGWWECRMRVLESKPFGYESGGSIHPTYLNTIQLLTGKTHQIRAQLSALGCPVLGDEIYGGGQGDLQLECHSLSFNWRGKEFKARTPDASAMNTWPGPSFHSGCVRETFPSQDPS